MMNEPLSANLVERYLRTRGRRYFRGQHDGEFFFAANVHPRSLHFHLEISPVHRDVFTIRVTPACFFPAADHDRLAQFADAWNAKDREVIAVVHGSSDPQRVGMAAQHSQWFAEAVCFNDFADFLDRTIAAAVDLFGALTPVADLPAQPLLRDAG